MVKQCGTCRWWRPCSCDWPDVGTCDRVVGHECQEVAFVEDGSGAFAALRTREAFGCVLWEEKP
jgi:hypothetical protein